MNMDKPSFGPDLSVIDQARQHSYFFDHIPASASSFRSDETRSLNITQSRKAKGSASTLRENISLEFDVGETFYMT